MATILTVGGLSQHFGNLAALDDLTFSVEEGEIFGIAGPNGAGKSTLFNVISGFYRGSGRIQLKGKRIDRLPPHAVCRLGIGRTFQLPTLFTSMSVLHNVEVGARFGGGRKPAGGPKERALESIRFVGLAGKENHSADGLKLFDMKLTMLAAALATEPQLLLLDEAVGGLSPLEAEESLELFRKINRERGVTIVIIEHLMNVITELCTRLMILHNGARICLGQPADVMSNPNVQEVYLGRPDA